VAFGSPGWHVEAHRRDLFEPDTADKGGRGNAASPSWHPVRVDEIVVARASDGLRAYFPDVVSLGPGRLLAAYREGEGHLRGTGRIMTVGSRDGGQTWSPPVTAVDGPHDDRDPKLARLSDGMVLLSYFVIDWTTEPRHTVRGTYVRRSTDDGVTWSEPVRIVSRLDRDGTGEAATHGPIVELPGGDLLAPIYGARPAGTRHEATVVRSRDGGRSWQAETEVTLGAASGISFQEPNLVILAGGEIVALIRTTAGRAYLCRSSDGGRTWSTPTPTDLPASSHHLLPVSAGGVLVTYGDISGRFAPRRHTVGRLVARPHETWNGWPDLPLYDSGHDDQANPSSVEVSPGRFLTLSFDVTRAAVVGVFSTADDYRPADGP
jgi:Neuraminidase (sialidase)